MVAGLARSNDFPLSSTTSDFSEYAHFSTVVDTLTSGSRERPPRSERVSEGATAPDRGRPRARFRRGRIAARVSAGRRCRFSAGRCPGSDLASDLDGLLDRLHHGGSRRSGGDLRAALYDVHPPVHHPERAFAAATSIVRVFFRVMKSLFWRSVTWRPGTPALSSDSGKPKCCPTGHRRQEARGEIFARRRPETPVGLRPPSVPGHRRPCCGRNAGYPTPPAQIPASPLGHGAPTSGI